MQPDSFPPHKSHEEFSVDVGISSCISNYCCSNAIAARVSHASLRTNAGMLGLPFIDKVNEQRQLFETLSALPEKRNLAIDLGAGSGFRPLRWPISVSSGYAPSILTRHC